MIIIIITIIIISLIKLMRRRWRQLLLLLLWPINMFWHLIQTQPFVRFVEKWSKGRILSLGTIYLQASYKSTQCCECCVLGMNGKFDPTKIYLSCKNKRHWKGKCPICRLSCIYIPLCLWNQLCFCQQYITNTSPLKYCKTYLYWWDVPFVSGDFASLDGKEKVCVKILQDMGVTRSFIVENIWHLQPRKVKCFSFMRKS